MKVSLYDKIHGLAASKGVYRGEEKELNNIPEGARDISAELRTTLSVANQK